MNGILNPASADDSTRVPASSPTASVCFHCGESCPDAAFARGGKNFCCQGCRTVHELLAESGLAHFYDLNEHPGIRMRRASNGDAWAYLNEPALSQKLLDFTDGRISRVTFRIPAIHCIACVWLLENLFRLHAGVTRSQVNFPKREVTITFSAEKLSLGELAGLLASIGYDPALTLGELDQRQSNPLRQRRWMQLGIAGFAFGNVMLFSLPVYFGLDSFSGPLFRTVFGYASLAIALPVLTYSAGDYWRSALLALRQRMLTLDVPIALGLVALYSRSAFEIVTHSGEGYLDSLTGLVFFLLCGRAFQHKTYERLAFDRDYKSFFPLSITRIRHRTSGSPATSARQEERVSLSQLEAGNRLLIRNGELIPVDSTLVNGAALIDYSFVTGESQPVAKKNGDYLYAGGKQVGGAIEIEAVKAVSQSYLTSLWNHEAFLKDREAQFKSLTDRFGRWFTIAVVLVSLGAALAWIAAGDTSRAIKAFISVLIVACPCALALAAPFTFGTAQRLLARLGVFLKNSSILERLARVDTVVLDKTGTLTEAGAGEVCFRGEPLQDREAAWILRLAAQSTHPLSVRIKESLTVSNPDQDAQPIADAMAQGVQETPGCGLKGTVAGHAILLGSESWLQSSGVKFPKLEQRWAAPQSSSVDIQTQPESSPARSTGIGFGSNVHVAIDGIHRGLFQLQAVLRPGMADTVQALARHYEVTLLSGDNERERERFQSLFHSGDRLHFNQSPLDKLSFIRGLQATGKTVLMAGDGLNDAGALRQSDVGVAVTEQTGAFSPACDLILDARQTARLPDVLAFARHSTRIVHIAFGISILYNVAGISIAAAGLLSPLISALLMPASSITVVLFACAGANLAARKSGLAQGIPLTKGASILQPDARPI